MPIKAKMTHNRQAKKDKKGSNSTRTNTMANHNIDKPIDKPTDKPLILNLFKTLKG